MSNSGIFEMQVKKKTRKTKKTKKMKKTKKTNKRPDLNKLFTMAVDLIDMEPNTDLKHPPKPSQRVYVRGSEQGIYITPEGYGDKVSGPGFGVPILIEKCNGVIRVVVWSDINDEEPTHIVDIEGAKEDNRYDNQ